MVNSSSNQKSRQAMKTAGNWSNNNINKNSLVFDWAAAMWTFRNPEWNLGTVGEVHNDPGRSAAKLTTEKKRWTCSFGWISSTAHVQHFHTDVARVEGEARMTLMMNDCKSGEEEKPNTAIRASEQEKQKRGGKMWMSFGAEMETKVKSANEEGDSENPVWKWYWFHLFQCKGLLFSILLYNQTFSKK